MTTKNTMTVTPAEQTITLPELKEVLSDYLGIRFNGQWTEAYLTEPIPGVFEATWESKWQDDGAVAFATSFTTEHPATIIRIDETWDDDDSGQRSTTFRRGEAVMKEEWEPSFLLHGTFDLVGKLEQAIKFFDDEADDEEGDTIAASASLRDAAAALTAALRK